MARLMMTRDARYRPRGGKAVKVTVCKLDAGQEQSFTGELIDIGRGGARLVLGEAMPLDGAVEIRLQSADLSFELCMTAEICWCQAEASRWALGCRFVPKLPEENLTKLFVTGLLERRFFSRKPRRVSVTAKWEMEADSLPAALWDLSDGGFCLLMPTPRKVGSRVLVSAGDGNKAVQVPAKAQWDLRSGDGWIVGCEFITRTGYDALRSIQSCSLPADEEGAAPATARERRSEPTAGKPAKASVGRRLRALVGL